MSLRRGLRIASACLGDRLAEARIRDRAALERRQVRLWAALQPALAATPALTSLAGRPLADFPVREPSEVRADLALWNSLGLGDAAIRAAAAAAEAGEVPRDQDVQAGFSTGSAGSRGVFLTRADERDRYIGTLLGRLIPPLRLLRPIRAALILRANNGLYKDVGGAGAAFAFLGLDQSPEAHHAALTDFRPTHLIAPPQALVAMARLDGFRAPTGLEAVFYGAEPLGDREARDLAGIWSVVPRPLYQATEGFLGAPCQHGALHLNERDLVVELEPIAGGGGRFRPILTDLRRRSQPVVRIRLDDLITPAAPCSCGSPERAILPVEGRIQDVWRFENAVPIFPREVADVLDAALPPLAAWTAQASATGVMLTVQTAADDAPARQALEALLAARGVRVPVRTRTVERITTWPKRRRIGWTP